MGVYRVKRFSYGLVEGVNGGSEYISSQVDTGLEGIHNIAKSITEDERLKNLRPVKKWVRLVRDASTLLRRRKKKKNKNQ